MGILARARGCTPPRKNCHPGESTHLLAGVNRRFQKYSAMSSFAGMKPSEAVSSLAFSMHISEDSTRSSQIVNAAQEVMADVTILEAINTAPVSMKEARICHYALVALCAALLAVIPRFTDLSDNYRLAEDDLKCAQGLLHRDWEENHSEERDLCSPLNLEMRCQKGVVGFCRFCFASHVFLITLSISFELRACVAFCLDSVPITLSNFGS
jgi:hypothetical protein